MLFRLLFFLIIYYFLHRCCLRIVMATSCRDGDCGYAQNILFLLLVLSFFLLVTHLFFYFNLTFLCCVGVIGVKRNNFPECSKNKHGNSLIPSLTCQFYFNVCVFTKMKSLFCCVLVTVSSFQ